MTYQADRLYNLLPAVYRRRDADAGEPLRALLTVLAEQAGIIDADLDQLYDDWFIETCQPWVVTYLGELVGYEPLAGSDAELATGTAEASRLAAAIAPRRDVADTVAARRRKGTLAILEQVAVDVANWPARAVEFRRLLAVSQSVRLYRADQPADRRRSHRGRLADLRRGAALDLVDGPFDQLAHTVAVSRISSQRRQRFYDIAEVGLYLWRLRPYSISHAPAFCRDRDRAHFTFSVLGNDTGLVTAPRAEPSPNHIADVTNVPGAIRRRAFTAGTAEYYGPHRSLAIWAGDQLVDLNRIVSADLSDWRYRPRGDQVAVDPVLGRIAFPARTAPDAGVWVSYHYALADDLGGGEYPRPAGTDPCQDDGAATVYRVGPADHDHHRVADALTAWQADKQADAAKRHAVIELTDSGVYSEQLEITLDHADKLTIRAAAGTRPVLRLLDWYSNRPDALRITGTGQGDGPLPRLALDGLMVTGRSIRVKGALARLGIRHCTLVPGWSLDERCCAEHPAEPGLELYDTDACVQIEHSIIGSILVNESETSTEPNRIYLSDSVLDATARELDAVSGPDGRHAYAIVNARRSTVFGAVRTHGINLLENSIFAGDVQIARRQRGCVRFCWLPPSSRTPARFHCEPELSGDPLRVVPLFTDTAYGTAGYAQLRLDCADEIRRGADDASELGVFHDLFQPQREDNLRGRLAEYTPAGSDAGLIFVT